MKVVFNKPFTLEIEREGQEDLIIKGTIRDFKKRESKEVETQYKTLQADLAKGKELEKKYEIAEGEEKESLEAQIKELEEKIENEGIVNSLTKKKFDLTVKIPVAEHMEIVRNIIEDYGYQFILDHIKDDLDAKKL